MLSGKDNFVAITEASLTDNQLKIIDFNWFVLFKLMSHLP